MNDLQWYDYARLISVVFLAFILYKEGRRFHFAHTNLDSARTDLWWVYLMAMFLIFYGSLEAVYLNADGGPRSALALAVVAVAFKVSLRKAPADNKVGGGMVD